MSEQKQKKQFGIWIDKSNATIVGLNEGGEFQLIDHVKPHFSGSNSNEHTQQNAENTETVKYFKEIMHHIPNVDEVHITGPGIMQEKLQHYLADTAQYKNAKVTLCSTQKMNDDALVAHIGSKFGK